MIRTLCPLESDQTVILLRLKKHEHKSVMYDHVQKLECVKATGPILRRQARATQQIQWQRVSDHQLRICPPESDQLVIIL